jgi:hypothetical protein
MYAVSLCAIMLSVELIDVRTLRHSVAECGCHSRNQSKKSVEKGQNCGFGEFGIESIWRNGQMVKASQKLKKNKKSKFWDFPIDISQRNR